MHKANTQMSYVVAKSEYPAFDAHNEFSYQRQPLPSIGNILVTLLGFFGGALVLVYIGVTH